MSRLDTNVMTWEATEALLQLDRTFINTPNYLGVQYFWAYKYRHYLRDVSSSVRRRWAMQFIDAYAISRGWIFERLLPNKVVDFYTALENLHDLDRMNDLPEEMVVPFRIAQEAVGSLFLGGKEAGDTTEKAIKRANDSFGHGCVGD